jgi:hypothetical protein
LFVDRTKSVAERRGKRLIHAHAARIEPGAASRFILTGHSPIETVANLRRPRTVVVDGVAFTADCSADVAGL